MSIDVSDWMGLALDRNPAVGDISLCQFPMPGSHDAGSYGGINTKNKTQHYPLDTQLMAGVRYFDFRVRVDDGVFFSHHGPDESRDNPYTAISKLPGTKYLFDEIVDFLHAHTREVVVINFQDFTSVWGQSFTSEDAANFIKCIKRDFGAGAGAQDLLYTSGDIPAYGKCLKLNRRIILIINDNAWPGDWDRCAFQWSASLRDRFSDYKYAVHSWPTLVNDTLADQQNYLASTDHDGRALNLFWVSQAVLGYDNITTPNGESQSKAGASHLNKVFVAAFIEWWQGGSAIPGTTQSVPCPNVLLMDYSGVYENFATDCYNLLV